MWLFANGRHRRGRWKNTKGILNSPSNLINELYRILLFPWKVDFRIFFYEICISLQILSGTLFSVQSKLLKQAGTVLGQAQLKLELEIHFTTFKICRIKLVKLVKMC